MSQSLMTCAHCNKDTPGHSIYCVHCGVQLNKECPDCAEIIKLKASVCRYCGFRFVSAESDPGSRISKPSDSPVLKEGQSKSGERGSRTENSATIKIGVPIVLGLLLAIIAAIPRLMELPTIILGAAEGAVSIGYLRGFETDTIIHFGINWIIWSIICIVFLRIYPGAYRVFRILARIGAFLSTAGILVFLFFWTYGSSGVPTLSATALPSQEPAPSKMAGSTSLSVKPSDVPDWIVAMPPGSLTWMTARDTAPELLGDTVTVCGPVNGSGEVTGRDQMTLSLVERPEHFQRPFQIWIPTSVWERLPQPVIPHFGHQVVCATGVIGAFSLPDSILYHLGISSPNSIVIIDS